MAAEDIPATDRATYFAVFGALLALTALTVAAARADLGALHTPIALAIAATKAILVVLWFMHVRHADRVVRIYAVGGVVWLAILLSFTLTDTLTRTSPGVTRGSVAVPAPAEQAQQPQRSP